MWLIPVCYVPVAVGGRKEIVLTAWIHHFFLTQDLLKTNPAYDTKEPMKCFLVHTMLFVGSI
jgi:hypothetical protein